jgi:hypothetical protein
MANFEKDVNQNTSPSEEFRIIQAAFNCQESCPSQISFRKVPAYEVSVES